MTEQPVGQLVGGPHDGLRFPLTGFLNEMWEWAPDVLVTAQGTPVPFWDRDDAHEAPWPDPPQVQHYTLRDGKDYRYDYVGEWEWKDCHHGEEG